VSDAPASYVDALLRAIVGFELTITNIQGKWKMSQNRDAADRAGVRDGLLQDGHGDLSRLMDGE
jgi:transcriptional regulator